jgi:hypothetical protein
MPRKKQADPPYRWIVTAPANGRTHAAEIRAEDADGKTLFEDRANLSDAAARRRVAKGLVEKLKLRDREKPLKALEEAYFDKRDELRRQRENGQADARAEAEAQPDQAPEAPPPALDICDTAPDSIRRPLCLAAAHAYACAWPHVRVTVTQGVNTKTGEVVTYNPPRVQSQAVPAVVRDDGQVFLDPVEALPGALPFAELGLEVRLPFQPPPDRSWSGAGLKRFAQGERPDPGKVFNQVYAVANRFMDFDRSLADQPTMCKLVACFVLASYLLDAFNVAPYLWPNGDKGAGKTNLLVVICEMAYLGQVVLAGGTYASLRDLADYGATLAFDDAEVVMDVKRMDPDKRALLLAGNRRGATVTVKEKGPGDAWYTRHVNTYCPRMFSAIRLPDDVLGSRTIILPLVRSSDPAKAKAQVLDHSTWPCDRRRLLDDLWALGLAHLRELRQHDAQAAAKAKLSGRDLEPWRAMLAVAHWQEFRCGYEGLFAAMEKLSVKYQEERSDLEARDPVRVAIKALFRLLRGQDGLDFAPKELASAMNAVAAEDGLVEDGADGPKDYTNARKVGWLLKRLRFSRDQRGGEAKRWKAGRADVEGLARAYGMTTPKD